MRPPAGRAAAEPPRFPVRSTAVAVLVVTISVCRLRRRSRVARLASWLSAQAGSTSEGLTEDRCPRWRPHRRRPPCGSLGRPEAREVTDARAHPDQRTSLIPHSHTTQLRDGGRPSVPQQATPWDFGPDRPSGHGWTSRRAGTAGRAAGSRPGTARRRWSHCRMNRPLTQPGAGDAPVTRGCAGPHAMPLLPASRHPMEAVLNRRVARSFPVIPGDRSTAFHASTYSDLYVWPCPSGTLVANSRSAVTCQKVTNGR